MKKEYHSRQKKRKRSKRGTGRLYKRDATGKEHSADWNGTGSFYLAYTIPATGGGKGKRIRQALKDADGQPITDRRRAEAERKRILAPYQTGSEIETLKAIRSRIADAEERRAAAIEQAEPVLKIKDAWSAFTESPGRPDSGEGTFSRYASQWKRFLAWLERERPEVNHLHEVTKADAKAYAKDLTDAKFSASTYNQHRNSLRMVWRVMADDCRLIENPWDKIAPKKLNSLATRKRSLTPAQFESLIAAVEDKPDMKDLFTVLAWTGLRLADAILMKWGSVDFSKRVISLAPIKTARRQGKMVHIPIFPAVMEILDRRQGNSVMNPKGFVFPELAKQYRRDATAISKSISAAFVDAGMQTAEKRSGRERSVVVYGAHSLRHYFVTQATAAGMPGAMIKSITGHSTDGMLEHYQQLGIDLAADLAKQIGGGTPELPAREPVPEWVIELLEQQTAKNWKKIKSEILEGGAI